MIKTKKELLFYIKADRMMNIGLFNRDLPSRVRDFLQPVNILNFLEISRKYYYYKNCYRGGYKFLSKYYNYKLLKIGPKLGFSICLENVGYGLVIPHYGTIVVGNGNTIGNYMVLHTSTCITAGNKIIGDGFYVSTGAKILKDICVPDGITVSANSVLNKSINKPNGLYAGAPAERKKDMNIWYIRDGEEYTRRVQECEKLKKDLGL